MPTVVVSGAAGHQGSALIRELVANETSAAPELPSGPGPARTATRWTIIALTRDPSSTPALALSKLSDSVCVAVCDLDREESVEKAFVEAEKISEDGRVDAVVCILAFPGLGVDDTCEVKQGTVSRTSVSSFVAFD